MPKSPQTTVTLKQFATRLAEEHELTKTTANAMLSEPVAPVEASALKCVWAMFAEARRKAPGSEGGSVGFDVKFLAEKCGAEVDHRATMMRLTLLSVLMETKALAGWLDGDEPRDVVFETLAGFPLPGGVRGFRPEDFLGALRKAQ